jgi:hypothetical protein
VDAAAAPCKSSCSRVRFVFSKCKECQLKERPKPPQLPQFAVVQGIKGRGWEPKWEVPAKGSSSCSKAWAWSELFPGSGETPHPRPCVGVWFALLCLASDVCVTKESKQVSGRPSASVWCSVGLVKKVQATASKETVSIPPSPCKPACQFSAVHPPKSWLPSSAQQVSVSRGSLRSDTKCGAVL